jgi:hypothetical protein
MAPRHPVPTPVWLGPGYRDRKREYGVSVYIFQPDALDLLTQVEGQSWREQQEARPNSEYGFFAYLKAWQFLIREGYEKKLTCHDVLDHEEVVGHRGDGAIYGNGGWSRFVVTLGDGRIVLLGWSTHAEKIEKAKALGFDVTK